MRFQASVAVYLSKDLRIIPMYNWSLADQWPVFNHSCSRYQVA